MKSLDQRPNKANIFAMSNWLECWRSVNRRKSLRVEMVIWSLNHLNNLSNQGAELVRTGNNQDIDRDRPLIEVNCQRGRGWRVFWGVFSVRLHLLYNFM